MVTELAKPQNNYELAFQNLRELKPTAPWVELVRESAMERFKLLGFPTVADEEWKYTNLATLAKEDFLPIVSEQTISRAVTLDHFHYFETAQSHVVSVNGYLHEEFSNRDELKDVVVLDLFEAIADARYSKIVRSYLARNAN